MAPKKRVASGDTVAAKSKKKAKVDSAPIPADGSQVKKEEPEEKMKVCNYSVVIR